MHTFSPNTSRPQTPKPLVKVPNKPQFIRPHSTIPFPIPLSQSSKANHPRRRAFSFFPFLFSTRRKASKSTITPSSSSAYPSSQNTSDTQIDIPRVRQLDKATRMLGERIPPELVLGPPKSPQHCIKPSVPLRTRSSSPSLFPPTSRSTPEPRHKRSYLNIVRSSPQLPEPDQSPNMSRPSSRTSTEEETSRYLKTFAKTPPPGTPFIGSAVESESDSYVGSRKKWQQSWSGEWNVKNMDEVIGKLRHLR
ncbi:uncharacterized protein EV420DRAFT_1648864 [Desarmillaria tabescens]|uniref:Uncharacterized protein n=1 Tax=Armillaria tabescens TaxID=1929756 RepID=A0AA39MSW2_ARMTA|nr:uncharacterized protein EV420DRAFT_1648864 [Desarmillaria tabescens]KAK0444575.1 hypothetical protein EV420DRAFT_1648864 [Desarmillaria tabescens]